MVDNGVPVVPTALAQAVAKGVGWGGPAAAAISGFALLFSAYTFYDANLRRSDIEVYLPPVVHYARDFNGEVEVFALPITVTNDGASSGAVLLMTLEAENLATKRKKTFFSAYTGEFPREPTALKSSYAPIVLQGRGTYSGTVLFYPRPDASAPRHLIEDAGKLRLTLTLQTSSRELQGIERLLSRVWSDPAPVSVEVTLPVLPQQGLDFRRDTAPLYQAGFLLQAKAP